ncbi:MAG: radical SAM protein [Desulfobacteraceae bacterium]
MALNVSEIFFSLQGESTFAGLPCVFVRLFGCNLACSWCDTVYARDPAEKSRSMELAAIMEEIEAFGCSLVEITGGEPLLQKETPLLIKKLLQKKFKVLLETNGSLSIAEVPQGCVRIIDIKCPSSRESGRNMYENLELLTQTDQVKFVIADGDDYQFARQVMKRLGHIPGENIHLSPVSGTTAPEQIARWMLRDRLGARLSLQLHKIIWNPEKRGV